MIDIERPWPEEALDFGDAVSGALARAGGLELARRCEVDPELRRTEVQPVLEALGLLDLDAGGSPSESAAAALAAHAAGAVVCPWPVVQTLAVPGDMRTEADAIVLVDGAIAHAEHLDLPARPAAVDLVTGARRALRANGAVRPMPLDPFGVACEAVATSTGDADVALARQVVLTAFWVAGALGRARDLAADHARERRQFGRPIVQFGGTQWHLSEIALGHDALWELASFSLARMIDDRLTRADALALRLVTLESAHSVLTHAHQILGAMGLCEEHDLTVLTRHLQPALRRPCGVSRVVTLLAEEIGQSGFDGLYPIVAPVGV